MQNNVYTAIGLMSGTSLDGVDCALIETDGASYVKPLDFLSVPYDGDDRDIVRACFGLPDPESPLVKQAQEIVTREHAKAVKAILEKTRAKPDLIGFHGQTIYHAPKDGVTLQIGDAQRLADECGIDVIADFRSADVRAGGEGAPLAPVYHAARIRSAKVDLPCVVLNIGGVANVTWVGEKEDDLIAFDCGPGNALMDDWILSRTGARYDEDGKIASLGRPIERFLNAWMSHEYFERVPPKSLDRDEWDIAQMGRSSEDMKNVSIEDGAATLLEFTVQGILRSLEFMPDIPKGWYVCGGGRHNKMLMKTLQARLFSPVHSVDALGWNGDATEAECFAYLAVRSALDKVLSYPKTTGVPQAMTGGVLFRA